MTVLVSSYFQMVSREAKRREESRRELVEPVQQRRWFFLGQRERHVCWRLLALILVRLETVLISMAHSHSVRT